jgi:hypothetical protein
MPSPMIDPDLITREHAAMIMNVSAKTLERMDRLGTGPAVYRFGRRCVRYSQREAEAFTATKLDTRRSTREQASA